MKSQYYILFTSAIILILSMLYVSKFNIIQKNFDKNLLILENFKNEIYYISENNWTNNFSDFVDRFKGYLESLGYHNLSESNELPGYILGYLNTSTNFKEKTVVKSVSLCGKNFKVTLYPIKVWHCFCLELKTENGNYSEFFCT